MFEIITKLQSIFEITSVLSKNNRIKTHICYNVLIYNDI